MSKYKVYDKVPWHYPEGKNCPSLSAAKIHLKSIMNWLKNKNLLSDEGLEIYNIGVDADFAITSSMLTKKGNEIMQKGYSNWLKMIDYNQPVDLSYWESIFD